MFDTTQPQEEDIRLPGPATDDQAEPEKLGRLRESVKRHKTDNEERMTAHGGYC